MDLEEDFTTMELGSPWDQMHSWHGEGKLSYGGIIGTLLVLFFHTLGGDLHMPLGFLIMPRSGRLFTMGGGIGLDSKVQLFSLLWRVLLKYHSLRSLEAIDFNGYGILRASILPGMPGNISERRKQRCFDSRLYGTKSTYQNVLLFNGWHV